MGMHTDAEKKWQFFREDRTVGTSNSTETRLVSVWSSLTGNAEQLKPGK